MSVNHGRTGDDPPELKVKGTLMQIVPHVLSCFKISNTRLLELQCSNRLTNPINLTENSLLLKSTSSTSTKSPLQAEIQHFCGDDTDKNTAQNAPKRATSSEKFHFFWGGELPYPTPRPLPPASSLPNLYLRPRVPAIFTPLYAGNRKKLSGCRKCSSGLQGGLCVIRTTI